MNEITGVPVSELSLVITSLAKHSVLAVLLGFTLYGVWRLANQVIDTVREVGNGIASAMRDQATAMQQQADSTNQLGADIKDFGENVVLMRQEAHEQTILMQHLIKTVEGTQDE